MHNSYHWTDDDDDDTANERMDDDDCINHRCVGTTDGCHYYRCRAVGYCGLVDNYYYCRTPPLFFYCDDDDDDDVVFIEPLGQLS